LSSWYPDTIDPNVAEAEQDGTCLDAEDESDAVRSDHFLGRYSQNVSPI